MRRLVAGLVACVCVSSLCSSCSAPPQQPTRSDSYLIASDSPYGIKARKEVLAVPSPDDKARTQLLTLRILAAQEEDGSWAHDATATGQALRDLYFLGALSADDAYLHRALGFLLGQEGPFVTFEADSLVWGKDWVALYAVNLWGRGDEIKVRETVHSLLENQSAWLDRKNGRAASVILRAMTLHELFTDTERREGLLRKLAEWQLPGGKWDLGPGTSQLSVLCALLPMGTDARAAVLINRFLPNVVPGSGEPPEIEDPVLDAGEAHLIVLRALDLAGKLDSFRRGGNVGRDLAQYELALHLVAGPNGSGHSLPFEDAPVVIESAPLLVGAEIQSYRPILPPEPGKNFVRLFLDAAANRKLRDVIAADPAVEAVVVLHGKIVAKGHLADMVDEEGIAIRGLGDEDAAGLVQVLGTMEGAPAPAAGAR